MIADKPPYVKRVKEVYRDLPFVVYLKEPSTGYEQGAGAYRKLESAIMAAYRQVDEATKTEGWVYQFHGSSFVAVSRAFWQGDGEVGYVLIGDGPR